MLTHFSYSESVYFACVFLKAVLNEYPLPCTEKRKSTLQIPVHRDIDCNGVIAIIQNWTNSQCKYSAESILPFSKDVFNFSFDSDLVIFFSFLELVFFLSWRMLLLD